MQRFEPAYRDELAAFVATVRDGGPSACTLARGARGAAGRARRRPLEDRTATRRRSARSPAHRSPRADTQSDQTRHGGTSMGMHEETAETATGEETGGLSRRGLFVIGRPARRPASARSARRALATASAAGTTTKIAVVTHGDTGSFWSVFKDGVDQATKDMKGRGVNVTQVYANNDVSKQVSGINAAIASKVNVIATSVPDASALKDPLTKAAARGHRDHHGQLGRGRLRQPQDVRGARRPGRGDRRRGRRQAVQRRRAPSRSSSSSTRPATRASPIAPKGVKKTFKGTTKTLLIPNAKADIPGTQAEDQGLLRGQQGHRRAARARSRRDGAGAGGARRAAPRSARSTSTRP